MENGKRGQKKRATNQIIASKIKSSPKSKPTPKGRELMILIAMKVRSIAHTNQIIKTGT
jgi:hypothetical protein